LAAGVTIHEWGGSILHAKVATIDGRHLLVGSFNLDPFSLANLEALVEVTDARIVAEGEAWIHEHLAHSRRMTSVEAASRLQTWLLDPFGRLVARLADAIGRVIASRRLRRAYAGSRSIRLARRGVVTVVGFAVLAVGVALIVLPGPAVLVIPLGLAILATEFLWARNALRSTRGFLRRLKARVLRAAPGPQPDPRNP
jgi:uncharacterized protein (TIGR02611 family)